MPSIPACSLAFVLVAGMLLAAAPSRGEDAADLILRDGRFYTVGDPAVVAGSLAVRDGRIAFLGPSEEVEAWIGADTQVVALGGRAVTPGLIDAHSHLAGLGDSMAQVDLTGAASFDEVVERVAEAARGLAEGTWIRGRGWDQNDWPDRAFPTHGRLSRRTPDHPVWLTRVDGHAALLNARALALAGIDAETPEPPVGRIVRDPEGRPTGVLVDAAAVARGALPVPEPEEVAAQIERAARHCVSLGLTTVTDMGVGATTLEAYERLASTGTLPLRVAAFLTDDAALLRAWFERGPRELVDRLQVRGVKLYADGALGSRGAALVEPYSDDPGNAGLLTVSTEHLVAVCAEAVERGFQIGTHAIGDRGNLLVLDAFERCFDGGPRPELRFRVEHAQVMRLQDIERLGRLGIIASMQPTHATSDMPWAEARLGESRLGGAYAWRRVLEADGRLALGSDFPVEPADPRLGLHAAVTREDLDGSPAGGWLPDQRLTREEALRGFTLDAAWSLFLDEEIGSLEVGKRADLVVWGDDPMTVPAAEIPRVPIDLTIVEGEMIYRGEGPR